MVHVLLQLVAAKKCIENLWRAHTSLNPSQITPLPPPNPRLSNAAHHARPPHLRRCIISPNNLFSVVGPPGEIFII
ncbi:hypothetical protein HanXRQr2_Chr05g0211461 [Helianthus annuus]|uniref:Uncharacterized protein n=1 Tax=Helianthus annuus TaxID=4232 RepID=A0A9K3IZH7_HELAN|nr:hypothetical protein HanXRQr2_Chr05g0211461 [Helianthus annuus]